jgi:hypothetical protein
VSLGGFPEDEVRVWRVRLLSSEDRGSGSVSKVEPADWLRFALSGLRSGTKRRVSESLDSGRLVSEVPFWPCCLVRVQEPVQH